MSTDAAKLRISFGRVKARVVNGLGKELVTEQLERMVDPSAKLVTDESVIYKTVGKKFVSHERVKHALGQYVRYTADGETITTNRIEGFWAGLKRQLHGTHHAVSRKHLHRYVSEAEFKYNNRNLSDGERTAKLIRSAVARRLTYADQVGAMFRYQMAALHSKKNPTTGKFE